MSQKDGIKNELVELYRKTNRKNKTPLDSHEVTIIVVALGSLTASLLSGKLSEEAFGSLMGAFMGYTFGRIFNGWQGKE
jgi:hypothetical protein